MNTRKVKEIVKFDVERNIQNKWFVLLNVVMLIGILIGTNWSNISKFMKENNINFLGTDEVKIEILDEENLFYDDFVENCKEYDNFKIEKVTENKYSKDNVPESNVIFIEVERNEKEIIKAKIISKEGIDTDIYDFIYENLKETRSKVFAENHGITIEELNVLNDEIVVDRQMLGVDAENSSTKELIKVICVLIVYMSLIFVLSRIANEIAQEKVSKSIEYVLTSVSEKEYLLAKVLSSTLTVLIQLLYTFVYYIIGNMISSLVSVNTAGANFEVTSLISNVDSSIVSYVLAMCAYLIFTIFLTTLIQAALSSKTTSVSEAGNTTMLLISIIVILYIVSISAINTYTTVSPLMYAISCLPIVSTFFVPAMMIIGQATTVQIIISFIVLIASVPLIFNVCAKHFKNGILDYTSNKKKRFFGKKVKRQMDLKERQDYELRLSKAKKYAFTIGISMILLVFLEIVISFICDLALPGLLGNSIDEGSLMILINSITLIFALLITTGCIKIYSDYDNGEKKNLTSLQKFEIIFGGIALLAIVQIFLNWLYPKIGLDYSIFEQAQIAPGNTVFGKILYVAGMALVPAIFEELLFRKAILNSSKRYGNCFAVVFSALLFGLYHMNLNQGIFAFLVGIIFGIIAVKTNSIKYTGILHFLNNLYACIFEIVGENSVAYGLFNNIVIAIVIIGIIVLIKNLPKLTKIKKEDFALNKDCKLLLRNYTFVIAMVLMIVMFVATENILVK